MDKYDWTWGPVSKRHNVHQDSKELVHTDVQRAGNVCGPSWKKSLRFLRHWMEFDFHWPIALQLPKETARPSSAVHIERGVYHFQQKQTRNGTDALPCGIYDDLLCSNRSSQRWGIRMLNYITYLCLLPHEEQRTLTLDCLLHVMPLYHTCASKTIIQIITKYTQASYRHAPQQQRYSLHRNRHRIKRGNRQSFQHHWHPYSLWTDMG